MTRWVAFAALTAAVVGVMLAAARASTRALSTTDTADTAAGLESLPDGADHLDATTAERQHPSSTPSPDALPTQALLLNLAVSHGFLAAVLAAGIWLANVPLASLGVGAGPVTGSTAVAVGLAVGAAIAAVNTLFSVVASRLNVDPSEQLRSLLAPETTLDWALLCFVVFPIVAGFEELLFRGILVGAFAVGFDLSPWLLAVVSSALFAAGHGAQGRLGVVATGVLGFVLAAVFISTGSLLVVAVAHYVVNVVEFLVAEGFGWTP